MTTADEPAASQKADPPAPALPALPYYTPGETGRPVASGIAVLGFAVGVAAIACLTTAYLWYAFGSRIGVAPFSDVTRVRLAWTSVFLGGIGAVLTATALAFRGRGRRKRAAIVTILLYWSLFSVVWFSEN